MKHAALLFCLFGAWVAAVAAGEPVPAEPYHATIGSDGVQHVRIVGGDYFFKPSHVIVKVNMPVEFSVNVEKGIAPHSLVIKAPEAGISVDEDLSTDVKTIRFTASATGKYSYYCKNKLLFFKSHQERGMEGVIEVVE
jgi:plastocyanin